MSPSYPPFHLFKETLCCPASLEWEMELLMPMLVIFITFYTAGVNFSGGTPLNSLVGAIPSAQLILTRVAEVEPRLALQLKKGGNEWLLRDGKSPQRWEAAAGSPASTSSPATSHLFQGA